MRTKHGKRLVTLLAAAFLLSLPTACKQNQPASPKTTTNTKAPSSTTKLQTGFQAKGAVVGAADGLWAISTSGKRTKLSDDVVSHCAVDNRAQLVWFLTKKAPRTLAAFDLRGAQRFVVAKGLAEVDELIVDHGSFGKLGGSDPVSFALGLQVTLAGKAVGVAPKLGCDGDMSSQCYGDNDAKPANLLAPYKARYAALSKVAANTQLLQKLAARGAQRALEGKRRKGRLPAVKSVDRGACSAAPEECGKASPLPAGRYWLVVTANSRGDFYHESKQLYDPKAKRFVNLSKTPPVRTPIPLGDAPSISDAWLSSDGNALLRRDGTIIDFEKGVIGSKDSKASRAQRGCGWIGGGFWIGGPRG